MYITDEVELSYAGSW